MPQIVSVARVGEIPEGSARLFQMGDRAVAVAHSQGRYFAFNNVCRHKGGPLCEGEIDGLTVTCPWHSWEYNMETGECAYDDNVLLERYPVRIEGDEIRVELP